MNRGNAQNSFDLYSRNMQGLSPITNSNPIQITNYESSFQRSQSRYNGGRRGMLLTKKLNLSPFPISVVPDATPKPNGTKVSDFTRKKLPLSPRKMKLNTNMFNSGSDNLGTSIKIKSIDQYFNVKPINENKPMIRVVKTQRQKSERFQHLKSLMQTSQVQRESLNVNSPTRAVTCSRRVRGNLYKRIPRTP